MDVNVVYLLRNMGQLKRERFHNMGAMEISRESHLMNLDKPEPIIYNVGLDWSSAAVSKLVKLNSIRRFERIANEYYTISRPDSEIYRVLSYRMEALKVRGQWPDVRFNPYGLAWKGYAYVGMEYAENARIFSLAPVEGLRQPRQIFLIREGDVGPDQLLQMENAQQLFINFWQGFFPLAFDELKFVIQFPGETVYIPGNWSCARILLPGTNNYGFSGGKFV